jgi:hypothetical protein
MFFGALFTVMVDGAIRNYYNAIPDANGEWAKNEFIRVTLIIALLWLRSAYKWGRELQARKPIGLNKEGA